MILVDEYFNKECPVETFQLAYEFNKLLEIYKRKNPSRVLEIGSLYGGTLWHWIKYSSSRTTFVTIDKICEKNKDKQIESQKEWKEWAIKSNCFLNAFLGDSKNDEIYNEVKKESPFDFVFIDGDHSYDGVKSDYLKYKGLIRRGGMLVFHDILYSQYYPQIEVYKLWEEIKEEGNITQEIYLSKSQICINNGASYGIGIVYL